MISPQSWIPPALVSVPATKHHKSIGLHVSIAAAVDREAT
ncbi:hypothetical protein HMPREF9601_02516 [Cutibacterium acnes HL030PA1]|nr:hypothetical protein HMPREF9601_02516 [Cutibacterium acnes HL030PA1]